MKIDLVGAVQKEPELKYTPGGLAILNINVAGTEGKKPWFHQVTVFGAFAEAMAERLKPGDVIYVGGTLKQERWQTPEGNTRSAVRIHADTIRVMKAEGDFATDNGGGIRLLGGFNQVSGYGNLTKAPEMRYTTNGTPVANAAMAVNEVFTNKEGNKVERVHFFDLTAWESDAEQLVALPKGNGVFIVGTLVNDSFAARDGSKRYTTRIVISSLFGAEARKNDDAKPTEPVAAGEGEDLPF